MTLNEFTALLATRHPGATAARSADTGQKLTELKALAEKSAANWGSQVGEFTIRKV